MVMGEVLVECEQRYLHKYLFIQGGSHFLLGGRGCGKRARARALKWQEGATFEREREGDGKGRLAESGLGRHAEVPKRKTGVILPFRA